jgi:hypothetical protein
VKQQGILSKPAGESVARQARSVSFKLPFSHGRSSMPHLQLSDGRVVNVRRQNEDQLVTDVDFGASRDAHLVVEVIAVDGRKIAPTRMIVGDHYSIWRSHQAVRMRPTATHRAVDTVLSAAEAQAAADLFRQLAPPAENAAPAPGPATPTLFHRPWVREVLLGVVIAVLGAIVVGLLGLN